MQSNPEVERELEQRLAGLGFELVEFRWSGTGRRPLLRVKIDRPGSVPGQGVTLEDCAAASRAIEPWLDARQDVPERYVLEVSSPGVDRPLLKESDFMRFSGQRVALKGHDVLAGRSRRLEGELRGLEEHEGGVRVRLRLPDGDEVSIPRDDIAGANLVFTWR
jgi:ribosome maturation factor RimP